SAAERRGPVRLPLVLAGLGAGGCCLGASCRRSCPGAAVDCARHALGWVGLLAVLAERYSVSTRTPAMGRRDHHRRRARGDRDHGWSHTSAPRPAGSSWVRAWPSSPSPQLPRISPRSWGASWSSAIRLESACPQSSDVSSLSSSLSPMRQSCVLLL